MDRRRFLARVGLLTAGGVAGAGAGLAAEQIPAEEGPTARTARPAGPGSYVATATFRTKASGDAATVRAIQAYQKAHGIPVTGMMDQHLVSSLESTLRA